MPDSIIDWLKEKINAPLYITFFLTFISWNWRFFFTLFFEDKIPENSTRLEFAVSQLPERIILGTEFAGTFGEILNITYDIIGYVFYSFEILVVPILFTYILLYQLPKLHKIVHKRSLEFYFERKEEFEKQNQAFEERKTKLLKALESTVKEQLKVTKDIAKQKEAQETVEKSLSEEEKWELEFQGFKKSQHYQVLGLLSNLVTRTWIDGREFSQLGYVAVAGLGDLDKDNNRIELTDKGKYFVKRYLEEQS